MFNAKVTVGLKKGVADPEGKNVRKTLSLLGFDNVNAVNSARVFNIHLDADDADQARAEAEKMCIRLLANPVINTYDIELIDE